MNWLHFKLPGSLRWRLQFWYGVLLTVVLAGFGWTAWHLQQASLFTRVDHELEQRFLVLGRVLHPPAARPSSEGEGPPGRPGPPERFEPSDPLGYPPGAPPPPGSNPLAVENEDTAGSSLYEVVWDVNDQEIMHSKLAPSNIPIPPSGPSPSITRLRGNFREQLTFLPSGERALVGKNISGELDSLHQLAGMLSAVGLTVLLGSLGTGWLITVFSLRPLLEISSTAAGIAEGDLSRRIPLPRGRSEIADLVQVLNQTFSRVEASFARQFQFTADVSHELRTPISVVLTHAQNALARERSPEEYRESLAACHRAARRMKQLTEALLSLVRLDTGDQGSERTACRLDQLVSESVELLSPLAFQQNITICDDLKPVSCKGNPEQLAQVVSNLLSNAIRYNSIGGTVLIETMSKPGFALLSVRDTGQGIAREDIPHIFERFYRADKARSGNTGGAGLGLAIADAIVRAHGGSMEVSSELGVGSLFTVRLPV